MKRRFAIRATKVFRMILFYAAVVFLGLSFWVNNSFAEVDFRIGINIGPPHYRGPVNPSLVVIPGTYVYYVPDLEEDIFFYQGYWYRPWDGRWYRSRSYNGSWVYITNVPRILIDLPPGYHRVPREYKRIPYKEFNRNWNQWERKKYWDRDKTWHDGWQGLRDKRDDDRRRNYNRDRDKDGRRDGVRDNRRDFNRDHNRGGDRERDGRR